MNQIIYGFPHISYENTDGMYFYDQDIAMTSYVYTSSIQVDMNVKHILPGIGIVIAEYKNDNPLDSSNSYIVRIGMNDVVIYNKKYSKQTCVLNSTCVFGTSDDIQHITFLKNGRILSAYITIDKRNIELFTYSLPTDIDKYYLGFYSNKKNTIQDVSIKDVAPEFWLTNLKNTNGGRISFAKDTIRIENCKYDAEVELENISIPAGDYYFDCKLEDVDKPNDIRTFIFNSHDNSIDVEAKNIIDENGHIKISDNTDVNILIRGTTGIVKDICIKENINSSYVSTGDSSESLSGSYIKISTSELSKIEMSCIVNSVPDYDINEDIPYSIFKNKDDMIHTLSYYNMHLGQEYSFTLDIEQSTISCSTTDIRQVLNMSDYVMLLHNTNSIVNKLILTYLDGTVINVLVQTTIKKYVSDIINSPILVLDADDNPLDLSSSYRYIASDDRYIFTNWEREIFKTDDDFLLNTKASDSIGSIYVYGILSDNIDHKNIYTIANEAAIHSIDMFSNNYDLITENSYTITDNRFLEFSEGIIEKYNFIVIEYLKDDSYSINHIDSQYEVDISTKKEVINTCYDMTKNNQVLDNKVLNISTENDKYVVLRK